MHGAAPCPGSQTAITDFRGCRERHSAPWPFQSDLRALPLTSGSVPGSRGRLRSFLLSFPLTCLTMADWQPAETPLRGCRRKPRSTGAGYTPDGKLHTSDSPERRAWFRRDGKPVPYGVEMAARKDGHPRRVRTRWQCGSQRRMTAGTDRPGNMERPK